MATSQKTPTNKQYAAFPSLFKRTGEARRIKGYRANRDTFTRAIRMSKALDLSARLMVLTPIGAMVLSEAATKILKEDGGVESLLLNGYAIMPVINGTTDALIDEFLRDNNLIKGEDLLTQNMFDEEN